jgi:membrane protease YdiL (CAAX protease family)
MPEWATFALSTVALTLSLLFLTRRSRRLLDRARIVDAHGEPVDGDRNAETRATATDARSTAPDARSTGPDPRPPDPDATPAESDADVDAPDEPTDDRPLLTTRLLLINAATSQGAALAVLVAVAWWTAVPAAAFGTGESHPTFGFPAFASLGTPGLVALGVAAGVALAAGNEAAARLGRRVGLAPADRLRAAMAPGTPGERALLFGVVLPVIAVFEEALFRGALVGAFAAGLALDPWLLAVGSSVAFGLGHGAQGRLGIVVTGALGLGLAGLFVVTGSLLVPVVAHYVVNAAEFAAHEGP